jgi:hypothetical protein
VGQRHLRRDQPLQRQGGTLKGVELQYQQPFNFLPDALKGFGFIGNFTYVDSNVNYGTEAAPNYNKLTGQSKTTANATLYFERDKLSARVSAAKRSGFLTGYPGSNGNSEGGTHGSTYYDFSTSYKVRDNLTVTLEGINLVGRVHRRLCRHRRPRERLPPHRTRDHSRRALDLLTGLSPYFLLGLERWRSFPRPRPIFLERIHVERDRSRHRTSSWAAAPWPWRPRPLSPGS